MLLSRICHVVSPHHSNAIVQNLLKGTLRHNSELLSLALHSSRESIQNHCRGQRSSVQQKSLTAPSSVAWGVVPPPSLTNRMRTAAWALQTRGVYSREEEKKKKEKFHYWDSKNKEGTGNPDENLNGETRTWLWYKFQGLLSSNEDLKKSYDEVTKNVLDPLKVKLKNSEEKAKEKFGFIAKPLEKVEETIRDTVEGKLSKEAKEKAVEEEKERRHKEMEWDDDDPAESKQKETQEPESENEFVREAKRQNNQAAKSGGYGDFFSSSMSNFKAELFEAAQDLAGTNPKTAKRIKVQRPSQATDEANARATAEHQEEEAEKVNVEDTPGKGQLVLVKGQQSAWQKLGDRLRDAPLIQQILKTGRVIGKSSVGKAAGKVKSSIHDRVEDVHEFWETSQNPLIYKLSHAWDSVTSETDEALAMRDLRRLDPHFNQHEWKRDVMGNFVPVFLEAFLKGDVRQLKEWCGGGVYGKLKQEIRKRKADGLVFDHQVFDIENDEIAAIQADESTDQPPTIIVSFMAQQVNCIRNREGEIVEGAEDQIRANYYMMAFQREYCEVTGDLVWSVADIQLMGAFPYL